MLEFNPYEKHGVKPPFEMKNNPGFMPLGINSNSFSQLFYNWTGTYYHEGVDIVVPWEDCRNGTAKIESGIQGTVIKEGNKENTSYGRFIIIQATEKYNGYFRYYLLAHLSEKTDHLHEADSVSPGTIVAYVGNTGNCWTGDHPVSSDERKNGQGAHLHLQLYLSTEDEKGFLKTSTFLDHSYDTKKIDITNKGIVNSFDYTDSYDNRS